MFSAIVISDIHFRRHEQMPFDVDVELRNGLLSFLPIITERFPDLSLILVCGDIAFCARETEYAVAKNFLREVQARTGASRILVIPGNHDVERGKTDSADQRYWRSQPRQSCLDSDERDQTLFRLMENQRSGDGLFEPLQAYNVFAAAFGCDVSVRAPYWTSPVALDGRYHVEIRGLTSVLISNEHDEKDKLILGDVQVSDLSVGSGVINVTICHHPFDWLLDGSRQRNRIRHRSVLHITGHEHSHEVVVDDETKSVHLCSGALQPTRNPNWEPRLYAIGIDVIEIDSDVFAQVRIFGARWDPDKDGFVSDVDESHPVPIERAPPDARRAISEPDTAFRSRLVERIASLQSADRVTVASNLGMDLRQLTSQPTHRIPHLLVEYAQANNMLHNLWEEVYKMHGKQVGEANPFQEAT